MSKTISILVSSYNTAKTIPELLHRTAKISEHNSNYSFEIILVDDGSTDNSFEIACSELAQISVMSTAIRFENNFGQMAAILEAMKKSTGSAIVILSSDLQDPPELINDFIENWEQGFDMIGGERAKRSDGPVRDIGGFLWYRLILKNTIPGFPRGGADYALISREIADELLANKGAIRYLQAEIVRHAKHMKYVKYVRGPGSTGRRSGWNLPVIVRHILDVSSVYINMRNGYLRFHAIIMLVNLGMVVFSAITATHWQLTIGIGIISVIMLIAFNGLLHVLLAQRILKSLNGPVNPIIQEYRTFNFPSGG